MNEPVAAEPDSAPPVSAARRDPPFESRLVRLMALRLAVLTLFLAFVTIVYLPTTSGGFSSLVAFATVAVAYALAAVYTGLLRARRFTHAVAYTQIVTDQIGWTAIVYVTGGATSGAVSLYGLTIFAGAFALARRGAFVALASALAGYVGVVLMLAQEVIPAPADQDPSLYARPLSGVLYPMVANSVGLVLVASMSGYLAERLRTAGGNLALAEARAEQAERLAAIGRLATGLAHEIRNPLGGIAGSIELLKTSPSLTEEDRRLCEIVQREADRLNDLVGDMLDLARPRTPQPEPLDVTQLARDVVTLAGTSGRGKDVLVQFEGPPSLVLRADGAQLRQVLWNLVRNAVQASSAGDAVLVRIERREGGDVSISVSDRGPGIPKEARDRIFDAFFTTRSHGTGVGLAVVKRIIDAHGWTVEATGEQGAVFEVLVPASAVEGPGSRAS